MKICAVPLALLLVVFSCSSQAKLVGRWDPAAYENGKFEVQKTAFVKKEVAEERIKIESKHILVKVDYTGKLFKKDFAYAKK